MSVSLIVKAAVEEVEKRETNKDGIVDAEASA